MNTAGPVLLRGGMVWEGASVAVDMATWTGDAGGGAATERIKAAEKKRRIGGCSVPCRKMEWGKGHAGNSLGRQLILRQRHNYRRCSNAP
jgi:hypothetical protein